MDYEIHVGHKYLHAVSLFLSPLTILEFHAHAAEEYGKIRAELERGGTPIGPMDMLIAGHARSEGGRRSCGTRMHQRIRINC